MTSLIRASMAEASVSILNPRDSSVVSYALANARGEFEIKDIELGVIDGIYVQVKIVIKASDKIKIWNQGPKEGEDQKK